ncbi:putative transcriptional regulator YheO [Paenibacillus phyllosphaerae]|uniref:Putative transcriptional regulator YheO n=1 Tax=Paenibacillus phyllosphaerae TaxID=274593 RepID=A0A7W5AZ03_9BACL|nr:helix-turn-helix transcriptional regulator [Paenibacillus phyllosphaerae]MBB3111212.1 putative transcriptional regulator YheO [Paenibacillus phyllosphaerae]
MESIQDEMPFLSSLVKGLSAQFGPNCEVVLHDLTRDYDSTIVAIENGHITGRKVGDPGTNLGLEILSGQVEDGTRSGYVTQTKDGRLLRSTSLYMKDKSGKTIGSLCINFDITELSIAEKTLQSLTFGGGSPVVRESFVTNVNELLDALLQEAQEAVGRPVAAMTKEDKIQFIRTLDAKGAFLVKKAGERVCVYLNISKFTLYSYLEEGKGTLAKQGGSADEP